MEELDDIRKMFSTRDIRYITTHSSSIRPNQVLDIASRKYGGGDSDGGSFGWTALKFGTAAIVACVAVFLGISYIKDRQKKT